MTAVLLQVPSNVHEKRNIANASDGKNQKRTSTDGDGKERCDSQSGGGQTVTLEVLGKVVPVSRVILLDQPHGVEGKSIDGLARRVGKE